jgi:serine/threonine protein kinase
MAVLDHEFMAASQELRFWMPFTPMELPTLLNSPSFSPHALNPSSEDPVLRELRFVVLAKSFMFQMITAVLYLHDQNVAHRDIKPHNIHLTTQGCLKLFDFGVSWAEHEDLAVVKRDVWPEYPGRMHCQVSTG